MLICDRDQKWSAPVRQLLEESKVRMVQTPFQAPNCNAHAERFVRSVNEECLNRVIPLGERHVRGMLHEFVEHYHTELNHQGLNNELIDGDVSPRTLAGFAGVSDSAACSTTITEPPDRSRPRLGRVLGHYGLVSCNRGS
jgi:transposase InsO family protein